ncbi:hypothetical protein LT493_43835 [Streptomyces tricolor]|nr:hypothetical protein [Streptomyces tricolor]
MRGRWWTRRGRWRGSPPRRRGRGPGGGALPEVVSAVVAAGFARRSYRARAATRARSSPSCGPRRCWARRAAPPAWFASLAATMGSSRLSAAGRAQADLAGRAGHAHRRIAAAAGHL